jgi:hypothetical protein
MYKLYAKLKSVKSLLKIKNLVVFGGISQRVVQARQELAHAQSAFMSSKGNVDCVRKERRVYTFMFLSRLLKRISLSKNQGTSGSTLVMVTQHFSIIL